MNRDPAVRRLLFTTVEAAAALGVSRSTVYLLMAAGELESVKIGGLRRIPAASLECYIEGLRTNPQTTAIG